MRAHQGKKIDLHMERKNTPYVKPKMKPFGGEGQRLGAVVPSLVEAPTSSAGGAKPIDQNGKLVGGEIFFSSSKHIGNRIFLQVSSFSKQKKLIFHNFLAF